MIPAWVDAREYPFTPRVLAVDAGRISYLDEGDGPPVVMVHGTPTWSFLYRHLVRALAGRHRCVVPDLAHAIERPESVRRLVLFNTWMWSLAGERSFRLVGRLFGGPLGRVAFERLPLSTDVLWRGALADVGHAPPEERGPEVAAMVARFLSDRLDWEVRA